MITIGRRAHEVIYQFGTDRVLYEGPVLTLSFRYNREYVELVKTLPVKKWEGNLSQWWVPTALADAVVKLFPLYKLAGDVPELANKNRGKPLDDPDEYLKRLAGIQPIVEMRWKTKPDLHQIEGFNFMLERKKVILGDPMGLGKTKQLADVFAAIKEYRRTTGFLVLCGVNGNKYNWHDELRKHAVEGLTWEVADGPKKRRLEVVARAAEGLVDIVIINVESLRMPEVLQALASVRWSAVAVDEWAHKTAGLKNPESVTGKAIHKIRAEFQVVSTGTLIINTPLDAYNALVWLGVESRTWWKFKKDLCFTDSFGNPSGYKPLELQKLQTVIQSLMLRRPKGLLRLKEKFSGPHWVEMDEEQQRLYRRIKSAIKSEVLSEGVSVNPLTKLLRLKQCTSTPMVLGVDMLGAKIEQLEAELEQVVEAGGKFIVYSQWTEVTKILFQRLQRYNPAYVTGEDANAARRMAQVKRFNEDPDCHGIIGQINVLGTGFTLVPDVPVTEYFVDWEWSPLYNEQAEDRAWRRGQRYPVHVKYLSCRGTIDEKLHQILEEKMDLFMALVEGKNPAATKQLIQFILED